MTIDTRRLAPALVVLLGALLNACAGIGTPGAEAPPSDKGIVVSLLNDARTDLDAGQLEKASGETERALRIEPRNPYVWLQLAQIRLRQNAFDQAAALAAKANALAGKNYTLRSQAWRVIGDARAAQGNENGAQAAYAKSRDFAQSQ